MDAVFEFNLPSPRVRDFLAHYVGTRGVLRSQAVTKSTGEDWIGAPALAKELGITLRTLYGILDSGALPAYKLGRVIRIKRVDVEAFLESVKLQPGDLRHLYPPGEHDGRGR